MQKLSRTLLAAAPPEGEEQEDDTANDALFHACPSRESPLLIPIPFRPEKALLAGLSGSVAPCLFSAVLGRHARDVICLPRHAVNNLNPAMQSERVGL
jgi:hypothetical protein